MASGVTTGDEQYEETSFINFWVIRGSCLLPETLLERSGYLTSKKALAKLYWICCKQLCCFFLSNHFCLILILSPLPTSFSVNNQNRHSRLQSSTGGWQLLKDLGQCFQCSYAKLLKRSMRICGSLAAISFFRVNFSSSWNLAQQCWPLDLYKNCASYWKPHDCWSCHKYLQWLL